MNKSASIADWYEANHRYMRALVGKMTAYLEGGEDNHHGASEEVKEAEKRLPSASAIEACCAAFGLSSFERSVLLLCGAHEMDTGLSARLHDLHEELALPVPVPTAPTFALAMAQFKDAHWSAIVPGGVLRK